MGRWLYLEEKAGTNRYRRRGRLTRDSDFKSFSSQMERHNLRAKRWIVDRGPLWDCNLSFMRRWYGWLHTKRG